MSQQEAMTLKKFQEKFDAEQTYHEHMFQIRWPKGFCCPRCKGNSYYFLQTRKPMYNL